MVSFKCRVIPKIFWRNAKASIGKKYGIAKAPGSGCLVINDCKKSATGFYNWTFSDSKTLQLVWQLQKIKRTHLIVFVGHSQAKKKTMLKRNFKALYI